MSWDDEDFDVSATASAAPVANSWDDEDADQEALADDWENADAPKEKETKPAAAPKPKPEPKKHLTKRQQQKLEEEAKREAERKARELANNPQLKFQEKEKQRMAVETASARLAQELFSGFGANERTPEEIAASVPHHVRIDDDGFGLMDAKPASSSESKEPVKKAGDSLEDFVLITDADYEKLAALVAKKVAGDKELNGPQSKKVAKFLKDLCKKCSTVMKIDDVADLKRSVTADHSHMVTAQQKKKKAENKKATVKMSAGLDDDLAGADYDDPYDDFM